MPPPPSQAAALALADPSGARASLEGRSPLKIKSSQKSGLTHDQAVFRDSNFEGPLALLRPSEGLVNDTIAILREARPKCPSTATWLISESTGKAYAAPCLRRECFVCASQRLVLEDAGRISVGIREARKQGLRVRLLTLTDGSGGHGTMTSQELARAWNKLRGRLRRRKKLGPYVKVVELQERGALHLHVLIAAGAEGYIAQRDLSELALASGFGPICDVREIDEDGAESIAAYVTKGSRGERELAARAGTVSGYMAKLEAKRLKRAREKFGKRLRPIHFSNDWPAPIQAETRAQVREVYATAAKERGTYDPGPFRRRHELQTVDYLPAYREARRIMAAQEIAIPRLEEFEQRREIRIAMGQTSVRGPPWLVQEIAAR